MEPSTSEIVTTVSWFPVVTLIIGSVMTAGLQFLGDRRADRRDRTARLEQRRDDARLRRIEFQRITLVELQDRVADLVRAYGKGHHSDEMMFKQSKVWRAHLLPERVSDEIFSSQREVSKLHVRIRDANIRGDVTIVLNSGTTLFLTGERGVAQNLMATVADATGRINQRIGELLRTLDDDEDLVIGT